MSIRSIAERLHLGTSRITTTGTSDPVTDLAALIDSLDPGTGVAIRQRANQITSTLTSSPTPQHDTTATLTSLIHALTPLTNATAWLLLATINGHLPDATTVDATVRTAELDGTTTAITHTITHRIHTTPEHETWPTVTILTGHHLIDVHHTAATDFATGIQRVTREVTRRWVDTHHPTLIGWRPDLTAMRALTPAEAHRACCGGPPAPTPTNDPTIIPWHCTYILPELAAEVPRTSRLHKMAEYSGTTLNLIGYDLVPMTTAETCHEGLVPGFARNLAAARYARNVVAISEAAADEYRGWRTMLTGTGLPGPHIQSVTLSTEVHEPDPTAMSAVRSRLTVGVLPLVLVVGSHEPRKNHLAVLHAAELLWREGHRFSLTFIGGNSWKSDTFISNLARLGKAGRPVEAISAATDELLWGGYRVARFTLFPSLNEGFGLPVAESLACGTPVITSNFGSMKEIADAGGGALLINPRDDHSLTNGIRSLLTNDELHARLSAEARSRPVRTWDTYAAETWQLLTEE
jgi:glycosyltransferase involved in cell wall biosynthesis